jgi:hypothetical protein
VSSTGTNFIGITGAIDLDGGNDADTLRAAGLPATDKAMLNGGIGADTLVAGRNTRLERAAPARASN